jgi:hypothetical protein
MLLEFDDYLSIEAIESIEELFGKPTTTLSDTTMTINPEQSQPSVEVGDGIIQYFYDTTSVQQQNDSDPFKETVLDEINSSMDIVMKEFSENLSIIDRNKAVKRTIDCYNNNHKVEKRRKNDGYNALLQDWLDQNISNPYPSKEDKTQLALESGLSVRQVENWFTNTRKRKLRHVTLTPPHVTAINNFKQEAETKLTNNQ